MKNTYVPAIRWTDLAGHSAAQLFAGLTLLALIVVGGAYGFATFVADVALLDDRPAENRAADRETAPSPSNSSPATTATIVTTPSPASVQP